MRPGGGQQYGGQQYGGQQYGGQYGGAQQRAYSGPNAALYSQVRQAINQGNLGMAEQLLQRANGRDARVVLPDGHGVLPQGLVRRGRAFLYAGVQMDPSNMEYRTALNNLNMSGGYGGYRPMQEANMCDFCLQLAICNCCLNSCCNAGC